MKLKSLIPFMLVVFTAASLFGQVRFKQRAQIIPQVKLNLTDEQKTKLESLREEWVKEKIKISGDLRIAKMELRNLLAKKDTPEANILAKVDEITNLQNKMIKSRVSFQVKSRNIFTEEQWEKVKKLKRQFFVNCMFNRKDIGFKRGFRRPGMFKNRRFFHRRFDSPLRRAPERMMPWRWQPELEGIK